jgi:hypothetical protein
MSAAWEEERARIPAIFAIGSLLAACLPRDRRDDLLGDLEEGYRLEAAEHGLPAARAWYLAQILKSASPILRRALGVFLTGLLVRAEAGILGEPPMEIARRWMGKIFFLFATGWIVCVFGFMHPPALDPTQRALPAIDLPSSQGFSVYPHPGRLDVGAGAAHVAECSCWNALGWNEDDLILAAFGPPLAVVFASLTWIGFSDRRQVAKALRIAIFAD